MFSQKKIKIRLFEYNKLNLETNIFDLVDYPVEVIINKVLGSSLNAQIKIYGLSKNTMEAISMVKWKKLSLPKRYVDILVNDGDGERLIYRGTINIAIPVYNAPNVYVDIKSCAGTFQNTMGEIPPSSLNGEVPVPDVFEKIATDFGMGFKNRGVSRNQKCKNPYFNQKGLMNRLIAAKKSYTNVTFKFYMNRIEIFPKSEEDEKYVRTWTLTKEKYVGYPSFTDVGIMLNFDSIFEIEPADLFYLKNSDIEEANSLYRVQKITYNLLLTHFYLTQLHIKTYHLL